MTEKRTKYIISFIILFCALVGLMFVFGQVMKSTREEESEETPLIVIVPAEYSYTVDAEDEEISEPEETTEVEETPEPTPEQPITEETPEPAPEPTPEEISEPTPEPEPEGITEEQAQSVAEQGTE